MRIKRLCFWFVGFVMLISCHMSKTDGKQLSKAYVNTGDVQLLWQIHQVGKTSIPHLIDLIDTSAMGLDVGFTNPYSSKANISQKFLGFRAAYAIELILSTEEFEQGQDPIYFEGTTMYNIVPKITFGCIWKEDSDDLSISDLEKIKSLYQGWWLRNQDRPLDEIRAVWESGDKPLRNSPYYWY